jgi:transcriptional regulator with XRE-family HTH domain
MTPQEFDSIWPLPRKDLAELTGLSLNTIQAYFTGKRQPSSCVCFRLGFLNKLLSSTLKDVETFFDLK